MTFSGKTDAMPKSVYDRWGDEKEGEPTHAQMVALVQVLEVIARVVLFDLLKDRTKKQREAFVRQLREDLKSYLSICSKDSELRRKWQLEDSILYFVRDDLIDHDNRKK